MSDSQILANAWCGSVFVGFLVFFLPVQLPCNGIGQSAGLAGQINNSLPVHLRDTTPLLNKDMRLFVFQLAQEIIFNCYYQIALFFSGPGGAEAGWPV